jgi:hypothetical protein
MKGDGNTAILLSDTDVGESTWMHSASLLALSQTPLCVGNENGAWDWQGGRDQPDRRGWWRRGPKRLYALQGQSAGMDPDGATRVPSACSGPVWRVCLLWFAVGQRETRRFSCGHSLPERGATGYSSNCALAAGNYFQGCARGPRGRKSIMKSHESPDSQGVQRELVKLYPQWSAFLKRSYSSLRSYHDDLTQQAAEDLVKFVRQNPDVEIKDWTLLGFRILHRRIADQFRFLGRNWTAHPQVGETQSTDPSTDPERVAHYSHLLRRLVGIMSDLNETDRHLLLDALFADSESATAHSDAARKQLSRLRKRLRQQLNEE